MKNTILNNKLTGIALAFLISAVAVFAFNTSDMRSDAMLCGEHPLKALELNSDAVIAVKTTGCADDMHIRLEEKTGKANPRFTYVNPKNLGDGMFEAKLNNKQGNWEIVEVYVYTEANDKEYLYEPNAVNNTFEYETNESKIDVKTSVAVTPTITVKN